MIDKEFIMSCHRAILGRDPKNDSVVEAKLASASSCEAVIRDLLESAELQSRISRQLVEHYNRPKARIEVNASLQQQTALFGRIRAQWRDLGRQEPFWSVLTHDEYRTANIDDAARTRFYETGCGQVALLDLFCERNEVAVPRGVCLELGCGVGRVTKHLSKQFEKVIAVDISEGNLEQCQALIKTERLSNIECVLLPSPDAIASIPHIDCFYSTIVLQHNPPPLQKYLLEMILSRLKAGGVFLFQTQTYEPGYEFNLDKYLESTGGSMEMHSLPMHEILSIIARRECRLCEVAADLWTGRYGSHTFLGFSDPQEPRRGHPESIFSFIPIMRRVANRFGLGAVGGPRNRPIGKV